MSHSMLWPWPINAMMDFVCTHRKDDAVLYCIDGNLFPKRRLNQPRNKGYWVL